LPDTLLPWLYLRGIWLSSNPASNSSHKSVRRLLLLRLRALGGLSVEDGKGPLIGASTQPRKLAVLALLATAGPRGVSRDKVVSYLWSETDAERACHALRQLLYALRQGLQVDPLGRGTRELRLNGALISSDVSEFRHALNRGKWGEAATLYAGPFLDGFHLSGAPEFERWADAERAELASCAAAALAAAAMDAARSGDLQRSLDWWCRLARLDPLSSRAALGVIGALDAAGERSGALQHAHRYQALLRQQLDAAPDAAIDALVRRLREPPVARELERRTARAAPS
jgi:DNA-binding SARP family transcriptional activator